MCVWNLPSRNRSGVVIHDEFGQWIATARSNEIASSIVERHNNNEDNTSSKGSNNNIDPAKISWSSKVTWK